MDVSNTLEVPVEVTLRLTRMVNVAGVGNGVIRKTVPANSRVRVATLSKRQAGGPIMFKHSFSHALIFRRSRISLVSSMARPTPCRGKEDRSGSPRAPAATSVTTHRAAVMRWISPRRWVRPSLRPAPGPW